MAGYGKVSFLKFEAAGQSWYVSVGVDCVHVHQASEPMVAGCVCPETGEWTSDNGLFACEKSAIVDYLRANPLPGGSE